MKKKGDRITFYKNSIAGSTGAKKAMIEIASDLAENGRIVRIVLLRGPLEPFFKLSSKVEMLNLKIHGKRPLWRKLPLIRTLHKIMIVRTALKNDPAEVIISFNRSITFLLVQASVGLNKKIIASQRTSLYTPNRNWKQAFLEKFYYRFVERATSNSRNVLQEMEALVPDYKLVYTPNPYKIPPVAKEAQPEKQPYILAVGKLHHRKGYDVLFRALGMIRDCWRGWRLRIVGEGLIEDELKQLAVELQIDGQIDWLGVNPDPSGFFLESEIYVLPSRYEGVPNAMLDAMAYGLPIVISAVEGSIEYIRHEKNGLVFPIEDEAALAEALCRLIRDKMLRQQLGAAAFASAQEAEKTNTVKVWEAVIDEIA